MTLAGHALHRVRRSLFLRAFVLLLAWPVVASGVDRPDPPGTVEARPEGTGEVRITWSDIDESASGFNLYRDGDYLVTVSGSEAYLDSGLSPGETYGYRITAYTDDRRYSSLSSEARSKAGDGTGDDEANTDDEATTAADTASEDEASDDDAADEQDSDTSLEEVEDQDDELSDSEENSEESNAEADGAGDSAGVPNGYRLVFADEFDGNGLDSNKWISRYRWGPDLIINNEKQYYVDQLANPDFGYTPLRLGGGQLTIQADRTPDNLRSSANNQPYLSGAITTWGTFSMRYGYVEMRARMPRGKGLWPAFWLLHEAGGGKRPEIDVVEMIGQNTDRVYHTYHYYKNGQLRSTPSFPASGSDFAAGFHTYGMRWEPGRIIWSVDGRETARYESGDVSSEPMYLLLNLAVGGSWPGNPDGNTKFPAQYEIDYVRAYQQ